MTAILPTARDHTAPLKHRWGARIAWGWIAFSAVTVAIIAVSPYLMAPLRSLAVNGTGLASTYVDQPGAIQAALYVHVVFGGIALLLSPLQFARSLRTRFPRAHRAVGGVILVSIAFAAAAGLVIAPVNGAGLVGTVGFGLLAVLWATFAMLGFRSIMRRDVLSHRAWMIRAFALTYSGVTLRLWLPILIVAQVSAGTSPEAAFTNAYLLVPFLAWVPNLLVAEWLIRRTRRKNRVAAAIL